MSTNVLFGLDDLKTRNGLIFVHGWAFCPGDEIVRIDLQSRTRHAVDKTLTATYGDVRPDVQAKHSREPAAAHSGFYLYGALASAGHAAPRCWLVFTFASGKTARRELDPNRIYTSNPHRFASRSLRLRSLLGRGWALAKRAKFSSLWDKAIKRLRTRRPRIRRDLIDQVGKLLARGGSPDALLIVDHDLGGGANVYREMIIGDELAAGRAVLLLTFDMLTLQYAIEVITAKKRERFALDRPGLIEGIARSKLISRMVYNDAASFENPVQIPILLNALNHLGGLPLTVYIHDYLAICPSPFLLNDAGIFCGIPNEETCRGCLRRHTDGFASLHASPDIRAWRSAWGNCLEQAEQVVCFSESSKRYLLKAYPSLEVDRVSVRPHVVNMGRVRPAAIDRRAPLHIGVVGRIIHHKGAEVVRDLSREIARRGMNVPITIIGSLSAPVSGGVIRQTGDYARKDLERLIEQSGANLFLFPSICPETFSYVTEELIQFGVPLLCFDLGAPADRVANYERGKVVARGDGKRLLDDLLEFHRALVCKTPPTE